jgi:hypothetical protein
MGLLRGRNRRVKTWEVSIKGGCVVGEKKGAFSIKFLFLLGKMEVTSIVFGKTDIPDRIRVNNFSYFLRFYLNMVRKGA